MSCVEYRGQLYTIQLHFLALFHKFDKYYCLWSARYCMLLTTDFSQGFRIIIRLLLARLRMEHYLVDALLPRPLFYRLGVVGVPAIDAEQFRMRLWKRCLPGNFTLILPLSNHSLGWTSGDSHSNGSLSSQLLILRGLSDYGYSGLIATQTASYVRRDGVLDFGGPLQIFRRLYGKSLDRIFARIRSKNSQQLWKANRLSSTVSKMELRTNLDILACLPARQAGSV
jgi:hypothetical protein